MFLSGGFKGDTIDQFKAAIDQGIAELRANYDSMKKKAEDQFPPIKEVKNCNMFGNRMASISSYEQEEGSSWRYSSSRIRPVDEVVKYATDLAEKWKKEGEEIHAANLPAIESNKKLVEKLELLFDQIGIGRTYKKDVVIRGRTKKEDALAGYQNDISRCIRCVDDYEYMLDSYKRFLNDIQEYARERRAKEAEEHKKKEEEEKKTEEYRIMVTYQVKYGLPAGASAQEVIEKIVQSNPYSKLYVAMKNTRYHPTEENISKVAEACKVLPDSTFANGVLDLLKNHCAVGNCDALKNWHSYTYDDVYKMIPEEVRKDHNDFCNRFFKKGHGDLY